MNIKVVQRTIKLFRAVQFSCSGKFSASGWIVVAIRVQNTGWGESAGSRSGERPTTLRAFDGDGLKTLCHNRQTRR
jgi:hypothetical protein